MAKIEISKEEANTMLIGLKSMRTQYAESKTSVLAQKWADQKLIDIYNEKLESLGALIDKMEITQSVKPLNVVIS